MKSLLLLVVCAGLLGTGCGEEDVGAQNDRISTELFRELEAIADDDGGYASPNDVTCVRPKPERFECRAYDDVRDNVAAFAVYRVRDCGEGIGWKARLVSDPTESFPDKLRYDDSVNLICD